MNLIDLIVIAGLSVSLLVSLSYSVVLKLKQTKLLESIAQLWVDQQELLKEIERLSVPAEDQGEFNGGFLRFLSDSREMAFNYISEVQLAINKLDSAMLRGNEEKIAEAYKELISFLPSENQDVVD
jgi:hypothetical protein